MIPGGAAGPAQGESSTSYAHAQSTGSERCVNSEHAHTGAHPYGFGPFCWFEVND